jgi:hypothetical protein
MKNIILIIFYILIISCTFKSEQTEKTENLLDSISRIKKENNMLMDSILKIERENLYATHLRSNAFSKTLKVGKKDSIAIFFQPTSDKLPKYEIFKIIDKKEIKVGENNKSKFNVDYTPKSIEDNKLHIVVKMPFDGEEIKFQCQVKFNVVK